jgi:hypothetical protein
LVTGLGKQKIILGFPWLQSANPNINWQDGRITWKKMTKTNKITIEKDDDDEQEDQINNLK